MTECAFTSFLKYERNGQKCSDILQIFCIYLWEQKKLKQMFINSKYQYKR